jgi:hydroxymethylpyrimidine/phosphomethylpyrimidine kinase
LAKGLTLTEAIRIAKAFITAAIGTNPGLGSGRGPLNHFAPLN